ncbi:MAG: hypothetical protein IID48_11055 [Proteobacteria bacterium]|nr:hypothetical protein [Pseudomonadota bacterium]
MTAEVKTFPQNEAIRRRGKLTMIEVIEGARTPEEMMSLLAAAFPKATMGEVRQVIADQIHSLTEEVAKNRGELGALERVKTVVARDADRDDKTTLGQSLERLARQGDRDAAAILAEINGPDQKEFWRLFDAAVEVDPFWHKTDDGRYRCKKGALHDTPEKLVAAYRTRDPATCPTVP